MSLICKTLRSHLTVVSVVPFHHITNRSWLKLTVHEEWQLCNISVWKSSFLNPIYRCNIFRNRKFPTTLPQNLASKAYVNMALLIPNNWILPWLLLIESTTSYSTYFTFLTVSFCTLPFCHSKYSFTLLDLKFSSL